MKTYKAIIFDLDGTLLDTLEDLKDSVNFALLKHKFPARSLDEVRNMVGNGMQTLIERSVPVGTSSDVAEDVLADFVAHYEIHCKDKTGPYEGVCELLEKLKADGYKLAVVSNKNHDAVRELIPYYFGDVFDVTVGAMKHMEKKPAPETTIYAMEQLQVQREEVIYVGDSQVDVQTARNAKVDGIFVTWGFRSREQLALEGAELFADDTVQLYNALCENKKRQ